MRSFGLLFAFLAAGLLCAEPVPSGNSEIEPFVEWLLEDAERLEDVRFAEVAEAVSGRRVLPVNPEDPIDAAMLDRLGAVLDTMLEAMADPENTIHSVVRVNEISRHVESFLLGHLGQGDDLTCSIPPNASGAAQLSGYPDLRLRHEPSGRVFYIDPKVYREGSESSGFRSFYFEPKGDTNKILDDASHLVVGIAHGGKVDGRWQLQAWQIVDLIDFRVRLKAEFQSSNRELYKESAILGHGERDR